MRLRVVLLAAAISFAWNSTYASDDVFVTLTRSSLRPRDWPTSVDLLTPQEFKEWSPQTAGEAVRRLPSVQVLPVAGLGGIQTMQIRGSSTSQNLVLIDGRPVGGVSFGASQDLGEIPIEAIQRLELVRGGVSALYGPNAVGGVLNVITRRGPANGVTSGSAGYDYGSYGRAVFRAEMGSKAGPLDYFMYGDTQHADGFRDNNRANTLNVGTNLGLALPGSSKLEFNASVFQAETGLPGQTFIPTNQFNNDVERQATTPNAKQNTSTNALRTAYRIPLPGSSMAAFTVWGSERRTLFKDDFSDSDRMEASKGGEAQLNLPLGFTLGGNFIHDREDSTDHITPANTFIRSVENYSFFVEETLKWSEVTLIPSGRFDHHSAFGDTSNPRVQLIANVLPWLRLSGSAARSFRAPTIDDLYYPFTDFGTFEDLFSSRFTQFTYGGNAGLQPETAWTYDAGFELAGDEASLRATYFRSNVTNLIQTITTLTAHSGTLADPDVSASATSNVGKARRQGLELQIDHRFSRVLKETINYTYLENIGVPAAFTNYVLLANSPRHTVNGVVTYSPVPFVDWSQTLRYVDSRFSNNDQSGTKLGSMVLWDTRLSYRWNQTESFIQVNNVTGRRYEEQAGYPLPGRTFIGGVTIHWGGDPSKKEQPS